MEVSNNNTLGNKILQDIYSSVIVLDNKGMIQYINAHASRLLEIPINIEQGKVHFSTNASNSYNDKFYEYILNSIYQKNKEHKGTVKFISASGKKHVFRISTSYLEELDYIVITLDDLTLESTLIEKIKNSTYIFSVFLFVMGFWVLFCEFWDMTGRKIPQDILTIIVEIIGILIFIFILVFTHLPLKELGILTNHNKKVIKEGVIISAICVVIMFAIKIIGRKIDPTLFKPERSFFFFDPLVALSYIKTAGVQEFLARCVVQFNLERILMGKYKEPVAIILSGLLFSTLHIYYGFIFMVCAALLAMIEGVIYAKQKSLISIWIVHYVFGIVGMSLGLA
ncbi:MAG: CPBP family intramembrane metalloprotease [Lachnospiraceae bacterium]|nr:CPBP family intramembrane metalloprotease [Lachnospiraceae bacterium]